ncbi:MAG: DUF4139 domain-containing protein [Paracoccaceae bacterium]
MRHLIMALAFLPAAAHADLFQPFSKPSWVVVHPDAAQVGRTLVLDMPAGQHEIRLSDLPNGLNVSEISVELSGASLDGQVFRDNPTASLEVFARSPDVRAAQDALDAANEALAAFDDQVNAITARANAAQARINFLEGLGDSDLTFDVTTLRELGRAIAEDGAEARADIIAAQSELRQTQTGRKPLEEAVQLAQVALEAVRGPFLDASEISFNVTVPEAGDVGIDLAYWVNNVGWEPVYRMKLQNAEIATMEVERDVAIRHYTGEHWQDVDLTVTSLAARTRSQPSDLRPRLLRIEDTFNQKLSITSRSYADSAAEPISPEPAIEEEAAGPRVDTSGVGVRYSFDHPVTVLQGDYALLALAPLDFSVEVAARAVPSRNETAFRMLSFDNDSGERLLVGPAFGFVDGQAIGEIKFETIEVNDDVEIGFGPIHGLQLRRAVLDRSEGERGIISRGNVRDEQARLVIENLSARDWEVTVVDQVPYSEQEDLEIAWRARPAQTRQDVEDKRGILEWDLEVSAGTTQEIVLNMEIQWPDGKELR